MCDVLDANKLISSKVLVILTRRWSAPVISRPAKVRVKYK